MDDTPMLLELLRTGDPKDRETAAEMLGARDAERVATALAWAARNGALEGVRRRALESSVTWRKERPPRSTT